MHEQNQQRQRTRTFNLSSQSWDVLPLRHPIVGSVVTSFHKVAKFVASDVERLVLNSGIVRHRGKILSTINNANRALELLSEFDDLYSYFRQFRPKSQPTRVNAAIPSHTPESTALSKDLKKRGWSFVGPTTSYAFMQAMGLVNDHVQGCHRA